jgi:hypothetical protein
MGISSQVIAAQSSLYKACGFNFTAPVAELESQEYAARHYTVENKRIRFRIAKKTPTKTGQFVTMWRRMSDGKIGPYDQADEVDLFVINVVHEGRIGQFILPKPVLVARGIFSQNGKGGKRAMRVYAPWDAAENAQARKTKEWQVEYFIDITPGGVVDVTRVRGLL